MWPFSGPKLSEETRQRLNRKCGLAVATLHNCRAANPGSPAVCASLEAQVVHCHGEVVCREAAAAYEKCFKRVVNAGGRLQYGECDKHLRAMRTCLRKSGLDPDFR